MSAEVSPFRSRVALSAEQCDTYVQLADSLVDKCVAQCAELIGPDGKAGKQVDARKWKSLKTRENVTVHKSTERYHPCEFSNTNTQVSTEWIPVAKLICIGSIAGSLDDAMFGCMTPTQQDMALRSQYINDEFVDQRVLQHIQEPTIDEPFRYLGVKWAVRASALSAMIRQRDLVFIEATGVRTATIGGSDERVGYMLYHSITLQECPPLLSHGFVRGRMSACFIFRETASHTVELFATMTSDPGGNMPQRIAAVAATNALIAVSRVTECALRKKLAWRLTKPISVEDLIDPVGDGTVDGTCSQCHRTLSTFSSLTTCEICRVDACSRCITTKKLVFQHSKTAFLRRAIHVCNACIAKVKTQDSSVEIAIIHHVRSKSQRILTRLHPAVSSASVQSNSSTHTTASNKSATVKAISNEAVERFDSSRAREEQWIQMIEERPDADLYQDAQSSSLTSP